MARMTRFAAIAAVLMLLMVTVRAAEAQLTVGTRAPALKVRTIDGKSVDLARLRGKVVVLDFWATWCGPCRDEIPGLQAFHRKYGGRGLRVVGVSVGEGIDKPRDLARSLGTTYAVGYTSAQEVPALNQRFRFEAIPCTYIIDKRGVIRYAMLGYGAGTEQRMDGVIRKLLAAR